MSDMKKLLLAAVFVSVAIPANSSDFKDPTWPCVQRKVENLSFGLMWPVPLDAATGKNDDNLMKDASELGDALALRRVELEDLRPEVENFGATYNGAPQALALVFDRVFTTLSKRRTRIISGIGDFSLGQIALAEKIDLARGEMDELLAKAEPDFDRVDKLEEQIDWDTVIHTDRQRSITYLCETPQLIERRLFAIAQMLQQFVQKDG